MEWEFQRLVGGVEGRSPQKICVFCVLLFVVLVCLGFWLCVLGGAPVWRPVLCHAFRGCVLGLCFEAVFWACVLRLCFGAVLACFCSGLGESSLDVSGKHEPTWPNGQGVGLLIRRLRVRVPQGVLLSAAWPCDVVVCSIYARSVS